MAYRTILGWVGRKKRRACAKDIAARLNVLIDNNQNQESHRVIVTNKAYLDAFRPRPLGHPLSGQLRQLASRVQREMRLTGHRTTIEINHEVRSSNIMHIGVRITCMPSFSTNRRQTTIIPASS